MTAHATARTLNSFRVGKFLGGASLAAMLMAGGSAHAQTAAAQVTAPNGGHTTITPVGGDATKVTVTTNNVNAAGKVAFNRFTRFSVPDANSVTMVLPTGTSNLVNVVSNAEGVRVNGAVTSTLGAGGTVGGNLFFVTSGGMFVGVNGVINTGRLIVRGGTLDTDAEFGKTGAFDMAKVTGLGAAGTVTIEGRINAPGGVDIKSTNVAINAGAVMATGAAGFAAIVGSDVNTMGLSEGTGLVKVNGGIAIVGADAVTIGAAAGGKTAATLDARASGTLGGGIDIASAGTIALSGTLTAWDGVSAAAGNIAVQASKTAKVGSDFTSTLLANYMTGSTAATALTVDGSIKGGVVSLKSDAQASTDPDFNPLTTTVGALQNYLVGKLLEKAGSAIDVFYTRADASSAVTIGAGAKVEAQGALTVAATSTAAAEGSASAEGPEDNTTATSMAIALGIAQVKSAATVTVDGQLKAGGALTVSAANDASSNLEVEASSTAKSKSAAVGYTEAKVDAAVNVGAAAKLDGGSVTVTAKNAQADADAGFVNTVAVYASDGSAGGGSAAVSKLDITSGVNIAGAIGSVVAPSSVTIASETVTNRVINAAATSTGPRKLTKAIAKIKDTATGGTEGLLEEALGQFASAFDQIVLGGEEEAEATPEAKGKTTRFGAAVGVLFDNQTAKTAVTGSIVATGKVAVDSLVRDALVRNNVKASTAATKKDDGGQATSVAGAAAWSTADYTSHAIVGGTVQSAGLAVNAVTDRPRGDNWDLDFTSEEGGTTSDVTSFASDLMDKLSPTLKLEKGFFANSAGATAKTESADKAAISGTVSYTDIGTDTRAWINPNAVLTLSGDLTIKADTTLIALNLGGALPSVTGGAFGTVGGSAAGIAVAITKFDPTTVAGIGKGAWVKAATGTSAVNIDIDAAAKVMALTLAPQAGKANGLSGSGTFATNVVDGKTYAVVSKDARLDLGVGTFDLDAATNLELWTVGGSIAVTKNDGTSSGSTAGSVGIAGALNMVDMDTRARVADAGGDDAASAATATAQATPGVTAKNVAIRAVTSGSVNAISVAGTATTASQPAPPKPGQQAGTQSAGEKKGILAGAKEKLDFAATLINTPLVESVGDYAGFVDKYTKDLAKADVANAQDAGTKTTVTKGFGIAGSASVNLSDLTTRVETTNATFKRGGTSATGSSFLARASEGVDMLSVTGGAAIATGKKLSGSSTLVAGAYGLSYSNNATASAVSGGAITDFGNVNVEAAANGTRIGAGLALTADTTKTESGAAVSASVSHLVARDGASATVTDGAITGGNAGSLSVLAYNGLTMGAGAGGLSWTASNAAGGAATVIDIKGPADGDAAVAKLVRTPVSGFTDLSVRALTAARVAGVAAAGAVSTGQGKAALTASLSINLVSFDSTALIDVGTTGVGAINVGGGINVYAGDKRKGETEAVASSGKTGGTAGASMLGSFSLKSDTFDSTDPVSLDDLKGGTQILSIAVPIAASKGSALGIGFGWNSIDNDRTASIIGGAGAAGTPTITAGAISVQAIEHSDILALGVGIGGSSDGAGLMGSVSRNLISGSSSAGIGQSAGATNRLAIAITGAPSATPNVSVGASGDGGIFSLAGAVAVGKNAAGGLAVSVNDITRTSAASTGGVDTAPSAAGLHARIDGVAFSGTPDVDILANTQGRIIGNAIAGAASTDSAAIAGAASANQIAPTIAATASRLTYADVSTGDLKVRGQDASSIISTAINLAIGKVAGVSAGVSVNQIDADVSAKLNVAAGDSIRVRNLLLDTGSTAKTNAYGVGAAGGENAGIAGSIAVNLTNSDVQSYLTFTGGDITATGSVGVVAKRDLAIDVGAGVIAGAGQGAAIGASVIVNDLGGSADAQIIGNAANANAIHAFTGTGTSDVGARSLTVRDGTTEGALPQFDAMAGFFANPLGGLVKSKTTSISGVTVNASSTAATRTIAVTGAVAGEGAGIGVTGVVNNVTGTTNASVSNTRIEAGTGTNNGVGIDVKASSQQVGMTFAGALAGAGQGVAAAAPIISDGYAGTTSAKVTGGSLTSAGWVGINAIGNQSSTTLAIAASVSGVGVSASVAGVSPRFQSTTTASLIAPEALIARGTAGLAVNADSSARVLATFGSLAISGTGAGAGAVVVATNENKTTAEYVGKKGSDGLGTVAIDAGRIAITADGDFDAKVAGASVAGSAGVSLVGNGIGVVHRGQVTASADALNYDKRSAGVVEIKAAEKVAIAPTVGGVAISLSPTGGAASLGVIAVLSQSKVDALLKAPTVKASSVTVDATGYNQIDAFQLGVAVGGVGYGANVTYLGIGEVSDRGALTAAKGEDSSDAKVAENAGSKQGGGNKNMDQLAAGGSRSGGQIAGQTSNVTTSGQQSKAAGDTSGRLAFTQAAGGTAPAGAAADLGQARTNAAVSATGAGGGTSTIDAGNVTIGSNANLLSRSTNVQGTGGIVAAGATIAITRNGAKSFASIGDASVANGSNIAVTGGTLSLTADTGQNRAAGAPSSDAPNKAAEANIYAGSVGAGALSVGVADVKLGSVAQATSAGRLSFTNAAIKATDTTEARSFAVGAVAGGAAVNVVVANANKNGTVNALLSNRAVTTNGITVHANALGGASASSYAGSGGIIFAGNAAVAEAVDRRAVLAQVAEDSVIIGGATVRASSTPKVDARSLGVAISGGVAAGASVANATASGTVKASVGERGDVSGALTIVAEILKPSGENVSANASGSAGGYLAAANGASAIADTTIDTSAILGENIEGAAGAGVKQDGTLTVKATRDIAAYSESTGVTAAGLLAVGVQRAETKSSGLTKAVVDNVDGSNRSMLADATITADALDTNRAVVKAGAGGLGAGLAAMALTQSNGNALAAITPAADKAFQAGKLTVTATTRANYKANSDSVLATAAGASGTTSENRVTSNATVDIGRDTGATTLGGGSRLYAGAFEIKAENKVGDGANRDGGKAEGAGGGVVTGSAALSKTVLNQTATTNLANGLTLRQYGYATQDGWKDNTIATAIDAASSTNRSHAVSLTVGGAMQLPFGEVSATYNATNAVNVGNNVLIRGDQGINIGTNLHQTTQDTSAVQVYGLAAVGGGRVNATSTGNQSINIGDGGMIESLMGINVRTGSSAKEGSPDVISVTTQTDTFNQTALPLSTEAKASSTIHGTNTLNLGNGTIRSGRDVTISAMPADAQPSAAGTGHNPYLTLFSVTTGSGDTKADNSGKIVLDGTKVVAGYLSDRRVTVTSGGVTLYDAGDRKIVNGVDTANLDADRLGQFDTGAGNFSTIQYLSAEIAKLEQAARDAKLPEIKDPATAADPAAAREEINVKGSQYELLAQLGTLYETRIALIANGDRADTVRAATVIGGTMVGNTVTGRGIFAAGGVINLNTDQVVKGARTASLTANGGGKVTIDNSTGRDTILGQIFVPMKSAGAITYAGKAKSIDGIATPTLPQGADAAQGLVAVKTGATRSDIIVLGEVQNLGGAFTASTPAGNYAQFGEVNVASFSADAPTGLFTVSDVNGKFSQGQPLSYFYGNYGVSLYGGVSNTNPTFNNGGSVLSADAASDFMASWAAAKRFGVENDANFGIIKQKYEAEYGGTGNLMYDLFIGEPGNKTTSSGGGKRTGLNVVVWSSCSATCEFFSNDGDLGGGQGGNYVGLGFDGDSGAAFSNHYFYTTRTPNYYGTVTVGTPTPGVGNTLTNTYPRTTASTDQKARITATNVFITAATVDISGEIVAGPTKTRTLAISNTVDDRSRQVGGFSFWQNPEYAKLSFGQAMAQGSATEINLRNGLGALSAAGFGNIGAQFIRTGVDGSGNALGYIQVDDVAAGAGGTITISGKILNTNPLSSRGDMGGKLKVMNGYGTINVTNDTPYEIKLGTLNSGVAVEGRITLRDKNGPTTVFTSASGGQVSKQVFTNGVAGGVELMGSAGTSDGNPLIYQPTGNWYYVWQDSRTIKRDISTAGLDLRTVSPWRWADGGSAPQVGTYINLDTVSESTNWFGGYDLGGRIKDALNGSTTTGYAQVVFGSNVAADNSGFNFSSGKYSHSYDAPYQATLNTETAVRATYPIKIVFDQASGGGLNVASNNGGKISLTGALTYGGGAVVLSALNSGVEATGDGLVQAKSVYVQARSNIGSIVDNAPFRANLMGGTITAISSTGDVNLELKSVAAQGGAIAPIVTDGVFAAGNVRIGADASLIGGGAAVNLSSGGNVTLETTGSITGANWYGASNLASEGLRIKLPNSGVLTIKAGGDVAVQQVLTTGTDQTLRIGSIATSGDVLIKIPGSVVAADATATVDQAKLARFLSAAEALQLKPECVSACTVIDPAALGTLDQAIRAEARVAYGKIHSPDPAEANAALAKLTEIFGRVPAGELGIETSAITRKAKIAYQARIAGRDAFDRYALFDAETAAVDSRSDAIAASTSAITKINAFGTKSGISLSSDALKVTITDPAALAVGGELYETALSALSMKGIALLGATPTTAELERGLQIHLDDIRAPVATLLPGSIPVLTGDAAAQAATVGNLLSGSSIATWVGERNLTAQRTRATTDALGQLQQIKAFTTKPGLTLSADGRSITGLDFSKDELKVGGELYNLALSTLREQVNPTNGLRETVPLPTNADVERGLRVYMASLVKPLGDLLPGALPTLSSTDPVVQRQQVSAAITTTALTAWGDKQKASAAKELKDLFGVVPGSKSALATAAVTDIDARAAGSVWTDTMLKVSIPSTAFVPVADTQFESRTPVITARGVTLVAGNSIGAFDAQKRFIFTAAGQVNADGSAVTQGEKNLATAYLASAGPGDLTLDLGKDINGGLKATFTTRRDQPLQLNSYGTVNAVAAVDYANMANTDTGAGSGVLGNIFLNNVGTLNIGSIVSAKWKAAGANSTGCNIGGTDASNCDSRIRLVAPEILGVTSGASAVISNGTRLSNADGSSIVMGGLVRMEAGNGSIGTKSSASLVKVDRSIAVDTAALEVLRAAGDIRLVRRSNVAITRPGGTYGWGNDLQLGDVFAGDRLQIDNPFGGLFVVRLPSQLESENRNSRIVAGTLALRAAGDIGSSSVTGSGIVGQFDLQTPVIDQFVSGYTGYDYAAMRLGDRPDLAVLGNGDGFFALRGVVQMGRDRNSLLGARRNITVGTLNSTDSANPIASSITFRSDIAVGGRLYLKTDGDVFFPDPDIRITGLGVTSNPNTVDLSALELDLKGEFNYFNPRSIILGSLTAGGGTIESSTGSVTVRGTLFGNGGPETPFTVMGKTGVTVGSTGLGAVSLISTDGDTRVTGETRASDLTMRGNNISVANGIFGRSALLETNPNGTGIVSVGGSIFLQRDGSRPDVASTFTMRGKDVSLSDMVAAQDAIVLEGGTITASGRAMFLNAGLLTLTATGALNLSPTTSLSNIGIARLTSGNAAAGGSIVTLSSFSGGLLDIVAPVGITLGSTTVDSDVRLATVGALTLKGGISAGGIVDVTAGTIAFQSGAGIRDAAQIRLIAANGIAATTTTAIRTTGTLDVSTRGNLAFGAVKANGGGIVVQDGGVTLGGMLTSDGSDFRIQASGGVALSNSVVAAGSLVIDAGGDVSLAGPVALNGGNGRANLNLDAAGAVTFSRNAKITAKAQTASVRVNAGSVAMDTASSITGAAVTVMSKGAATLGDIKASEAFGQNVSLRSNAGISVGAITGAMTTVAGSGGATTVRGAIKSTTLTVSGRDDVVTNGIDATGATVTSTLGSVTLNGTTKVISTSPTSARLSVTAAKELLVNGGTSATGGMTLSAPKLTTGASGFLTDTGLMGALTTLKADTLNVRFETGPLGGAALRIDARGRSASSIADATIAVNGVRPVQFDSLWINKGAVQTASAINVTSLTMRDYLLIGQSGATVALQGTGTAPAATRTAQTGALSAAKLVVAAASSGAPAVSVNGVAK